MTISSLSELSLGSVLSNELSLWKEKYLGFTDPLRDDTVFAQRINQMKLMHSHVTEVLERIVGFADSVERVFSEMSNVSRSFDSMCHAGESVTRQDCERYHRGISQMCDLERSTGVLTKFKRDLEYNLLSPLRLHLRNYKRLESLVNSRNDKYIQLLLLKKQGQRGPLSVHQVFLDFNRIDSHLFEWMNILEDYQGDIMDSLLQTVKYLQYELFAACSHALADTLPVRIEFRPLAEMTPKQLEAQLALEAKFFKEFVEPDTINEQVDNYHIISYSARALKKSQVIGQYFDVNEKELEEGQVDSFSLSLLLSQGFEESVARKALLQAKNNTQGALDLLVSEAGSNNELSSSLLSVRVPTTIARIQRLKEMKRRLQEKNSKDVGQIVSNENSDTVDSLLVGVTNRYSPTVETDLLLD